MKQTFEYLMDALAILAMALAWVGLCLIPITLALLLASMALGYAHEAPPVPYSRLGDSQQQMAQYGGYGGGGYQGEMSSGPQPLGWKYPWSCCSGNDCTMIEPRNVQQTPEGYLVTLQPGDHPFITEETGVREYLMEYGDKRIKDSPDGAYHICLRSPTTVNNSGDPLADPLAVICFYKGPEGF
jgi:hypothetical protein